MSRSFKHTKPAYNLAFSVRVGKGKYKKIGTCGLWKKDSDSDNAPTMSGSLKGDYAEAVRRGLAKYGEDGVQLALFKNKPFKKNRDEDDEEEDEEDEEEEEEDEEEEEEEEKPSKRKSKKSSKSSGKSRKKKDDWDFDEEDD